MRRKKGRKMKQTDLLTNSTSTDPQEDADLSPKKKRNSYFSKDEMKCLVEEYEKRSSELSCGTREQKQKNWEEITTQLNNIHPHFVRTVTEVKKKWGNLCATRKMKRKSENASKLQNATEECEDTCEDDGGTRAEGNLSFRDLDCTLPAEDEKDDEAGDTPTMKTSKESTDAANYPEIISQIFVTAPVSGKSHCLGEVHPDILQLKQECVDIRKYGVQIEEERRTEEKQKWWEEKQLIQLQRQKLELEIMRLQSSV